MALGSLYTIEDQLAKKKKNLSSGFWATKKNVSFPGIFFTTELTRCLIELTSLTYGFGIM